MFGDYLVADSSAGKEYGRCSSLLRNMREATTTIAPAVSGSVVDALDTEFADAPATATPSILLRNAMDHALLNLDYVGSVVARPGTEVSVPALMGAIRIALLGTSHLSYVVSGTDLSTAIERMGGLYKLEIGSAKKFVRTMDAAPTALHRLPELSPPSGSTIRGLATYATPHLPNARITETTLLQSMQQQVIGPMLTRMGVDESAGALLSGHLFDTTSGAAHGYAWIDLDGVVAHFVTQFSWATNIANVVFNDYMKAVGQHPDS